MSATYTYGDPVTQAEALWAELGRCRRALAELVESLEAPRREEAGAEPYARIEAAVAAAREVLR